MATTTFLVLFDYFSQGKYSEKILNKYSLRFMNTPSWQKSTQKILDLVNTPETHTQKILDDLHVPERHTIKVVSGTAYCRYSAWTLALEEAISKRARVAGACGMPWQASSVGAEPVRQGVQSAINCLIGVVRDAATLSRKHCWRKIICGGIL